MIVESAEGGWPRFANDGFDGGDPKVIFVIVAPLSAEKLDAWASKTLQWDNGEELREDEEDEMDVDWESEYRSSW